MALGRPPGIEGMSIFFLKKYLQFIEIKFHRIASDTWPRSWRERVDITSRFGGSVVEYSRTVIKQLTNHTSFWISSLQRPMSFVFLKLVLCWRSVGFDFLGLIGGVVIQIAGSNVDRPNCETKNNGAVVRLFVLAYEWLVRTGFSSGYRKHLTNK